MVSRNDLLAFVGMAFVGVASRLLPHPPCFTAMNSLALVGSCCLGNRFFSCLGLLLSMLMTDFIMGFHSTLPFVYLCFGLLVAIGHGMRRVSLNWLPFATAASALLFFIVTNFGTWLTTSMYPASGIGLLKCYLNGVPFLLNQLAGDLLYGCLFLLITKLQRIALCTTITELYLTKEDPGLKARVF